MFHPAGTCRIGADGAPRRVVDSAGSVDGLDSLRVVDASIFPSIPRATIHFPIVAAAEKLAAEIVRPRAGPSSGG
jgi:choline dehydrogenase-like flavoprotein